MAAANAQHSAWWKASKDKAHGEVVRWVGCVDRAQRAQREDVVLYLTLASNFNVTGSGHRWGRTQKLKYNLMAAGIETAASLIAQARTAPIYTTSAGDFSLARKAEQRSRVIQSQFYDLGVFDLGQDAFFDAATTGLGGVYGFINDEGLPELERVLPNEIYVDDFDGRTRNPRSMARVRFPARETLIALWPKHERMLLQSAGPAGNDFHDFFLERDNQADRVKVYEIWHLPSRKGAKNGRHIICTDSVTLVDEPFDRDRFPFAWYRYVQRRLGFNGQGLAERLEPAQKRMSELARLNEHSQNLLSTKFILAEENSNVDWEDIDNRPGAFLKYRNTPPVLAEWDGTLINLASEYERIKQEAFDAEGFTNLSTGTSPAGAGASARAVRATDDIQSRRHICPTQLFQRFYLDCAQLICDLNDEVASKDPNYSITGRARTGMRTFLRVSRWKDLELPDGDYRAQMFPMAALPTTIQGKYAALEDWIQGGFVSKPQALDLMEFPDLESFSDLENANLDLVHWQIEKLLDTEPGQPPELPIENQDLNMAKELVNKAYLVAYRMEADEHVLIAFQTYLADCKAKIEAMAPPAPPMQAAAMDPNAAAAAQIAMQQGAAPAPEMTPPMAA